MDETVAMKSDLRSICVGMTDSGCSASFCLEIPVEILSVTSLLCPRGTAVVELTRISIALTPHANPFLVATYRKMDPRNRG